MLLWEKIKIKKKKGYIVREQRCKYPPAISYGEAKQKRNEKSLAI